MTSAQRIALPACGRAGILLGNRKNSKPEKCLKMRQNPTRQVHALLGAFSLEVTSTFGLLRAFQYAHEFLPK